MDLRKYSVSEFSEMLENEMKLNKEKCEKIAKYYEMKRDIKNDLEITYKIVAPVEKNVYYRRPLEMAYNYESTLWGMKEAQISSFTGVKNKEYFVNTINYCRVKGERHGMKCLRCGRDYAERPAISRRDRSEIVWNAES